jgi:hypothetical protein
VRLINSTNISKSYNYLSSSLTEHKKDHDIWRWQSRSWLRTGTKHGKVKSVNEIPTPPLFKNSIYIPYIILHSLFKILMLWIFCLLLGRIRDCRYQRVIRIRTSKKNRQHNGQKKKYKSTDNPLISTRFKYLQIIR